MDKEQIRRLLLAIVHQPGFRQELTDDPVTALATLQISLDPAEVPRNGVHLPPDREILEKLEELIAEIEEAFSHIAVLLQLGHRRAK